MNTPPNTELRDATQTGSESHATRDAPRTFSPDNTNPCPEMFSGEWTGGEE